MNNYGMNFNGMQNNIISGNHFFGMQNNMIPGMNFQPNLIANPLQNNPNLIQQYEYKIAQKENRIRELEQEIGRYKEIIIQKDLEISCLNKKINNNIMSGFYQMMLIQNMNQQFNNNNNNNIMNMNNPLLIHNNMNIHQNNEDKVKILIQSNIKLSDLKKSEKAFALLDIFKNMSLTLNYKPLVLDKTIEENDIYDGSIINISSPIYSLIFKGNNGKTWIIDLDGDCPFRQAIVFFCKETKITGLYQQILKKKVWFSYDAKKMDNILDDTPINKIFNSCNPAIKVML